MLYKFIEFCSLVIFFFSKLGTQMRNHSSERNKKQNKCKSKLKGMKTIDQPIEKLWNNMNWYNTDILVCKFILTFYIKINSLRWIQGKKIMNRL